MSKKVKVLVSVLVAVVLLTVGGTATVLAQENDEEVIATANETGTNGLLARVAGILGIPQEELVNAFRQAQQEMREEAFIGYLDKAVEKELITQEEADEIKEWWSERPEVLDPGLFQRVFAFKQAQREMRGEALDRPALRARISQAVRSRQMLAVPNGWGRLRTHRLAD